MPTVQKFDRSMIERFLKSRNLKYLVDSEGNYRVEFAYDESTGCELTVLLIAAGSRRQIYQIVVLSDKRIPRKDWERAIMACNTWNKENHWPKAYLYVSDPSKDNFGMIMLEGQIDLEKGIHQELFDDFTDTIIVAAHSFWEWAYKEQGF